MAKVEVIALGKKFDSCEIAVWNCLLQRIKKVCKSVGKERGNMNTTVDMLQSLKQYLCEDYTIEKIIDKAKNLPTPFKIPS